MKPAAAGAFQDGATTHKSDFKRGEESVFIAKVGALRRVNGGEKWLRGMSSQRAAGFFFPLTVNIKSTAVMTGASSGKRGRNVKI